MKLATLRNTHRDGTLVVVRSDNTRFARADAVASSLQAALDDWDAAYPGLQALSRDLESGAVAGEPLELERLTAPLPRAYEWVDGSAYLNHVRLVRQARNAEPPATLTVDPLVYQGGSGVLLGPNDDIELPAEDVGLDFEGEVCVVLGDTPRGTKAEEAVDHIRLVMLCNDVTLRNLIPNELAKGFGFFQSKPATAFSPFAVTPDELEGSLSDGRLHLNLRTRLNGDVVGDCDAGPEMHFSFHELIQHITRTRSFTAGTILGSGTVSNADASRGVSCLSERRVREIIDQGAPETAYLKAGDRVQIDVHDPKGNNLFGTIDQRVVSA
ncbi:MAG: fumarylacetoacetate hydrolase family protein [Myxococcota bacterium]